MTAWARLDSLYAGGWNSYFPTPVRTPVLHLMEKNYEDVSNCYDLLPSPCLQGFVAREYKKTVIFPTGHIDQHVLLSTHDGDVITTLNRCDLTSMPLS
jgi:hypothetical protein